MKQKARRIMNEMIIERWIGVKANGKQNFSLVIVLFTILIVLHAGVKPIQCWSKAIITGSTVKR